MKIKILNNMICNWLSVTIRKDNLDNKKPETIKAEILQYKI